MDYTEVVNGRTPTKEDVDSLIAALGVPEEGREITRQQVADALHIGSDNKRMTTIISAWKNRLFEAHNICMFPTYKGSWIAANPEDRITEAVRLRKHAVNRITKAITIAVGTDSKRLCSESVKVQNDMRKTMANAKIALAKGLTE